MPALSRADDSVLGRWWWTVDRWTLSAVVGLIGFGYIMVLAASPAVAERIHVARNIFIFKQVGFLLLAAVAVVAVSMLTPRGVKRLALAGFFAALALTAMTMVMGVEIKGARRWINLPLMTVQPSEFLKPCFAVVAAWLVAEGQKTRAFPGMTIALGMYGVVALLLKSQPDIGMLAVVTAVLFGQLFIAGLNLVFVGAGAGLLGAGAVAAYTLFPHVRSRVTRFMDPAAGDNYQVDTALEAFGSGGLLGRGPGEGHVKDVLPDAHADFVFAVAGEEFGMLVCVLIIVLFGVVVFRGLLRSFKEDDMFVVLATCGLVTSFGLQAFVNMASTLHLIPTKGMTLPFVSYGGSSALAVALGIGMLLALTRQRARADVWDA